MPKSEDLVAEAQRRLMVRGDTFLDSDGETLLEGLKDLGPSNSVAAAAVNEIEHRRSPKVE